MADSESIEVSLSMVFFFFFFLCKTAPVHLVVRTLTPIFVLRVLPGVRKLHRGQSTLSPRNLV